MATLIELLESEEKRKEDFNEKRDILKTNLKGFMNLCNRVANVNRGYPSSKELYVEGRKIEKEIIIRPNITGKSDGSYTYTITRSINFLYVRSKGFFIELISRFYGGGDESNRNLLYRKQFNIEELVSWNDENKMKLINWLIEDDKKSKTRVMNENDFYYYKYTRNLDPVKIDYASNSVHIEYLRFLSIPTEYLPGKIDTIPDFDCRIHFVNIYKKLKTEENNWEIINEWQFGRTAVTRRKQLAEQSMKIYNIKKELCEIGDWKNYQ
jgi:hypothetical protein